MTKNGGRRIYLIRNKGRRMEYDKERRKDNET
jgi:hypothetical protein